MKKLKDLKKKKGFTLVELIVVIAIIIILAALAVPRVTQYIADARNARTVGDMSSMYTATMAAITEYQATAATPLAASGKFDIGTGTTTGTNPIDVIRQNLEDTRPANIAIVPESGARTATAFSVTFETDAQGLVENVRISNGTLVSVDGATPITGTN